VQSLRGKQEDRRVKAQDGYLPSSYTGTSCPKTRSLPVSKSRTWPHTERARAGTLLRQGKEYATALQRPPKHTQQKPRRRQRRRRVAVLVAFKNTRERTQSAMIARFDHHPMLTAALALSTAVLVVVVITLATLLLTAAPPAAPAPSGSVGDNTPVMGAGGEHYGAGWNNYGHD
jgi:hypothetical protein